MRFAASCDACGARSSQCKAYMGAVVVWLYGQDAKQAWMTYQARATIRSGLLLSVCNTVRAGQQSRVWGATAGSVVVAAFASSSEASTATVLFYAFGAVVGLPGALRAKSFRVAAKSCDS